MLRNSSPKSASTPVSKAVLQELFSIPVEIQLRQPANHRDGLGVLETRLAESMREARLFDFSTGRVCAHAALLELGVSCSDIDAGESRQPLWPAGITGSISHCKGLAVAAVTDQPHCVGLGLDVEPLGCLEPDVMRLVCTDSELAWIDKVSSCNPAGEELLPSALNDWQSGHIACLMFCIKEAIFKCYFPFYQQWFDFRQATVSLTPEYGSWSVVLDSHLSFANLPAGWHLNGRYRIANEYCLTSAVLTRKA